MIEEKIVVSDSNIFFDLLSVDLLKEFFSLPCEIATTDFVIDEIKQIEQKNAVNGFIKSKHLDVVNFEAEELFEISDLYNESDNNVSMPDCSVWYYAKRVDGRLLTGDAKLRKSAIEDNVKVSGILYIFDNLVEYGIITSKEATNKLSALLITNPRLPKEECEKRIINWKNR